MLQNGPQAQCREESESANDQDRGYKQNCEERTGYGKSTQRCRTHLLSCEIPRDRKNRNHHKKSSQKHGDSGACVVPGSVRVQSAKRRAIVSDGGGIRVENLGEPVRARIGNARGAKLCYDRNRCKYKNCEGRDQHRKHGHLYVESLNFLTQVFWRSSHHQTGDKHSKNDEDEDSVETRAHPAKNNFAE